MTTIGDITKPFLTLELTIAHASTLSQRLQLLISNERQHVVKTKRDNLALMYWTMLFEYHQGIFTLLRNGNPTSAFALLRVFEESYLKLFIAMYGSENQFEALRNGTYQTDFEEVGKEIDKRLGADPLFGPLFKRKKKVLHSFTHSGPEQLIRQIRTDSSGDLEVTPNYSEEEVRDLVRETMPIAHMAACLITEFLEYPSEHQTAVKMFDEYVETQLKILKIEQMSVQIQDQFPQNI